jgi:hypothetical protein
MTDFHPTCSFQNLSSLAAGRQTSVFCGLFRIFLEKLRAKLTSVVGSNYLHLTEHVDSWIPPEAA